MRPMRKASVTAKKALAAAIEIGLGLPRHQRDVGDQLRHVEQRQPLGELLRRAGLEEAVRALVELARA